MPLAVVLVDYKGEFFPRHKREVRGTDLLSLSQELAKQGITLEVLPFAELDLRSRSFQGVPVFYQSSQDPDLHYKGYIEDLLWGLELQGARLIPGLPFMRAHHNKVMMEILRDLCPIEEVRSLRSRVFGTYEDFLGAAHGLSYPLVLKISDGDSARGVEMVKDPREASRVARRLMRSAHPRDVWDNARRWAKNVSIKPHSLHRRKLIAQPFIPGLDHDYKVVWMGSRVFLETRSTRPNDFRASGSGMRDFPEHAPARILELVDRVGLASGSAYASIDLMMQGGQVHVGEMQFLRFGTTPVVLAPHAWERASDGWVSVPGPFVWEAELARAMMESLTRDLPPAWRPATEPPEQRAR